MRKLILIRNSVFAFVLTLVISVSAFAQNRVVSGVIVDADTQEPIPSVTVLLQGTTKGVASDVDGRYELTLTQQEFNGGVLEFSSVGYISREIAINGNTTINVELSLDVNLLDDVVVVAYGTSSREALTGSVETISSKDLELRTTTSPIAAIEGTTTGVQTISASGQPGSSPELVIRGVGTLNGDTDPLYVVDGIQFEGGLASINQDDIENITILKDAASTSLYGSRAANGVVLITTKKGSGVSGRDLVTVNYNGSYGVTSPAVPNYDAVGPGEYYELMWEAYKNTLNDPNAGQIAADGIFGLLGYNPFNVPNDEIVNASGVFNPNAEVIYDGLDWYDVLQRRGSRQSHSISVSAGGENHNIFLSGSNLFEEGYVIETDYERTTGRLGGEFYPTEWLTFNGSLNISSELSNGLGGVGGSSLVNPFASAKDVASIYPVYVINDSTGAIVTDANGNPLFDRGEGYAEYNILPRSYNTGRNAIEEAILNEDIFRTNSYGLRGGAEIEIPEIEGLSFSINYGQDIQDYIYKGYESNEVGDGAPAGRYGETRFRRVVENFTQLVNYTTSFDDHDVEVTLGHESFDRDYSENNGLSNTQTAAGISEYDNFSTPTSLGGYSSEKNTEGYFARVNYNFQDKYYITGAVRRDGSSVFTNNKWGNFYSVGGSWRISNESFMDNITAVSNLKLRASYGEVGNDNLNDFYISQPLYAIFPNAGNPGLFWSTTGNEDLQWETIESWDVALEFELFDRVSGIFEFYRRNSTDLLYNVPIAPSEGQLEAPDNIGDMYNEGFEITLNGSIIQETDYSWNLGLQFSTLKNEITSLPSPFVTGSKRWAEGVSRFEFYLYDYAGVDPDNGDALFYMYEPNPDDPQGANVPVLDANGNHMTTNDYQDANRGYVGASSVPDLIGSIKNDVNFKNFDLSVIMTYQIGGEVIDYGYADMMHEGTYGLSLHPDAKNAWRAPGDVTNVPRLESGNADLSPRLSSRWLTDASYFSLRSVNLSYTLGQNISRDIGVNRIRVFVSGENLLLFTERDGLNPQINLAGTPDGLDYNPNRTVTLGVNISF